MGRADRRADLTITAKSADGTWTTIGTEFARGIVPEGVTLAANEGGPDTASMTLRRVPSAQWPDLLAFNRFEVSVAGVPVWGGRIWEAPLSEAADDVIAVTGRGWQYHLDDDLIQRLYVHTDMSAYRDQRSYPAADLTAHKQGPQVQAGDGVIVLGHATGYVVVTGEYTTATIDLGASLCKLAHITWERIGASDANLTLYSRASTSEDAGDAGDDGTAVLTAASGVISHSFTAKRYHHLILYRNGAGGTYGADAGVRITAVKLFGETAYESGGASVLKASQVVADALTGAPLLDTSTAGIATTAFSIPDLAPQGYQTPRQVMNAANAYEGNLLGVDVSGRVFYRERPTAPTIEVGAWSGSSFQDSSTNSAESLYNRVIVQGSGPDGSPISEVRTATSGLLNRQGFTRTAVLSVSAPMTTASAQAIGDVWLAEKSSPKLKGTLTVTGFGSARRVAGGGIHPSELLLRVGETIRLSHVVDPADGSWGRDGTIKSVSYSHDSETATVELDNERGRFETLLERLAVVTSQAVR